MLRPPQAASLPLTDIPGRRHMSTVETSALGAFISLSKAADTLGVSVRTLRRRVASGELPAYRSGRRIIRVRVDDLETLLRRVPAADRW
jgi:excisionase family DNA binding protein